VVITQVIHIRADRAAPYIVALAARWEPLWDLISFKRPVEVPGLRSLGGDLIDLRGRRAWMALAYP